MSWSIPIIQLWRERFFPRYRHLSMIVHLFHFLRSSLHQDHTYNNITMSLVQDITLTHDDFAIAAEMLSDWPASKACASFDINEVFSGLDNEMKLPEVNTTLHVLKEMPSYNKPFQDVDSLGTDNVPAVANCPSLDVDNLSANLEQCERPSLKLDPSMEILDWVEREYGTSHMDTSTDSDHKTKTKGTALNAASSSYVNHNHFISLTEKSEKDNDPIPVTPPTIRHREIIDLTISNDTDDSVCFAQEPGLTTDLLQQLDNERKRRVTYEFVSDGTFPAKKRKRTRTSTMRLYQDDRLTALVSPEPSHAKRRIVQFDERTSRAMFAAPMPWMTHS